MIKKKSIIINFILIILVLISFIVPNIKSNFNIDIDELICNFDLYDIDKGKFHDIFENERKALDDKIKLSKKFKKLNEKIKYIIFKIINIMMKTKLFPLFFEAVLKFGLFLKTSDEIHNHNHVYVNFPNLSWNELIKKVSFKKEHALEFGFNKSECLKKINEGVFYEYDYGKERNDHFASKLISNDEDDYHAEDSEIGIDKYISQRIISTNTDWEQKKIDVVNVINFFLNCLGKVVINYLIQKIDCEKAINLFSENDIGLKTNNVKIEKELKKAKQNETNYFLNYLALYILVNADKETHRLKNVKNYGRHDIEDMVFDCLNLVSFQKNIETTEDNKNSFCYESDDALLSYEAMYDVNQYFCELFVSAFGMKIFENNWGKAYRNLLIRVFDENSLGEMGINWN